MRKIRASGNPRIARRSCQERSSKLDDMNVLELVEESTVPKDAQILDCGWAMKMKCPSEVRARVVLKDYDCEMFVVLRGVARVGSQHVRCERSVHACSCFKLPVEQRAAGWLWLIKKAMDGMRKASKDLVTWLQTR